MLGCGVVAMCAATLLAQDTGRTATEQRQRREASFDVLARRFDAALARLDAEQARRRDALPMEELSVGRLRATVRGVSAQTVLLLLRGADSMWTNSWASRLPPFPSATIDIVPVGAGAETPTWMAATISWVLPGDTTRRAASAHLRLSPLKREEVSNDVRFLADLALSPWKSSRPAARALPSVATDTLSLARAAYEDLATSPFYSGRACLGGSLTACEQALGLRKFTPPYDDVLDAAGRAAMLADASSRDWPVPFAERQACIDTMDDLLCRRAFAEVPPDAVATWVAGAARRLLIMRLISGAASTGRLTVGNGPSTRTEVDDLRHLASDSLIDHLSSLRATIMARRPGRVLPTAATSWMALVAVAVIAIAGLRSSRWRVA